MDYVAINPSENWKKRWTNWHFAPTSFEVKQNRQTSDTILERAVLGNIRSKDFTAMS
jgi:hypothetical protein